MAQGKPPTAIHRDRTGSPTPPPHPPNALAVTRVGGLVLIRVVGIGNMVTAVLLTDLLEKQWAAGFRRFVFELSQCRGLDSTFMGCMVSCRPAAREGSADALGLGPGPASAGAPPSEQMALNVLYAEFARAREKGAPTPAGEAAEGTEAAENFVAAINVSPACRELLGILGVDNFVKVLGQMDLPNLEWAVLPEKQTTREERQLLILKAHENLVGIDSRNEQQFGSFIRMLSLELAKRNAT